MVLRSAVLERCTGTDRFDDKIVLSLSDSTLDKLDRSEFEKEQKWPYPGSSQSEEHRWGRVSYAEFVSSWAATDELSVPVKEDEGCEMCCWILEITGGVGKCILHRGV